MSAPTAVAPTAVAPTAAEPRWTETDCAIYCYVAGRCVAFARRRVADRQWEVMLTGPGHLVFVYPHRGKARGKLRRLVAGLAAEIGGTA